MKKNVNGINIDMTETEIAEFQSQQTTIDEFQIALGNLRLQRNNL